MKQNSFTDFFKCSFEKIKFKEGRKFKKIEYFFKDCRKKLRIMSTAQLRWKNYVKVFCD